MPTLNISLPEPLKEYIKSKVKEGEYSNASDFMRHLIREHENRKNFLFDIENPLLIEKDVFVPSSQIILDSIPENPPKHSNSTIKKYYPKSEGGDGWIVMTRNGASNGKMWVALEEFNSDWSHASGSDQKKLNWFIPPKYGREYHVKVYDKSGEWLPNHQNPCWKFHYDTGILIFEGNRKESGLNEVDTIKIKAYRYIGKTLADLNLK
jgi:putative addiction module CopG family antidote